MVYYHTSGNVKMLRNILLDYGATNEFSPYEYIKTYIEKYPDASEDAKLSWIVETFLGIRKHYKFLKDISNHLYLELSNEEQDYLIIILHAVTFQIQPKELDSLYKCLFNLSKLLLNTFTKFLSNNEILSFISEVAQAHYDTSFITDKIIEPLFQWQPYISEMAHSYAEYVKKLESRKLKPPTVPIQPNVLNRKGKEPSTYAHEILLPNTPPNSLQNKGKRMLTKSTIDKKLKQIHEKNKQKAAHLLKDVKNKDFHFAQEKSEKYFQRISNIRDEIENNYSSIFPKPKPNYVVKKSSLPVKETAASLKRINKRIEMAEQEEIQWLQDLIKCCNNTNKIEAMEEFNRQEQERERLIDIEKKHLLGQITHEEAHIAKKKLQEENCKKYEQFLREKEAWNEAIEKWKKNEIEKNRKQVERLSLIELNLIQAKNGVIMKKKEMAAMIKKESELAMARAMKEKKKELERKINMIKEIKVLAMIIKKAKVPKIIDLTETSGFGFLCEMSMAELQERLNGMKIALHDELERKKELIKNKNFANKQELENTKQSINNYMAERAMMKNSNKKTTITINSSSSKEISELRKILEQKRKQRLKMTN